MMKTSRRRRGKSKRDTVPASRRSASVLSTSAWNLVSLSIFFGVDDTLSTHQSLATSRCANSSESIADRHITTLQSNDVKIKHATNRLERRRSARAAARARPLRRRSAQQRRAHRRVHRRGRPSSSSSRARRRHPRARAAQTVRCSRAVEQSARSARRARRCDKQNQA